MPAMARQMVVATTIFFKLMRKETQQAVAPRTTAANIGIPAREMVIRMVTAAAASARKENPFNHRRRVELAAATKTGATVHRYIERLLRSEERRVGKECRS